MSSTNTPTRYGFYDRLTAEFPSQVVVDVTEFCNLECIHCPHPEFKKSDHYNKRVLDEMLNAKMVAEVRAHSHCTQYIRYTSNGEPLIAKKIFNMLALAARESAVKVCLTTNGTLLTVPKINKLLDTELHLIDISIDAFHPETYGKIRRLGNLERTRTNVRNLLKENFKRGGRTKIVVSYIEQPENRYETEDFRKFWQDEGADQVLIRKLHSSAGSIDDVSSSLHAKNAAQQRRPCLYPWERITLNPYGFLSFCPTDWVHGAFIEDYRTTTIKDVWQGEFMQKLRQAHLANSYGCHKFCGQCPDWALTQWPDQGRSYANMVTDVVG